jgi:hypothetical protein
LIFCEICKAIRLSSAIIADITTLNFNVLFELGYAIGEGKPVLPIRDTTYERDKILFDELGIFDTIGYKDFQSSRDIVSIVTKPKPKPVIYGQEFLINRQQPIYYVKSPIDTDASIKLNSYLKKGAFDFRTFDSRETARLSMHEAYKQVISSLSIVAHLMDPNRRGACVHNALSAFVCGMALSARKRVLMLQEGLFTQPIDYRDIIERYTDASMVPSYIEKFVRGTGESFMYLSEPKRATKRLLERVDLGDLAAENEIRSLPRYFVKTPVYQQCIQGHARLVVGRKGSGKTAIFYGLGREKEFQKDTLVVDLKPEGHQFVRLKEKVLENTSEGLQLHILTAFWNYILSLELARKIIGDPQPEFFDSPKSFKRFRDFQTLYKRLSGEHEGDFSERLMAIVERVIEAYPDFKQAPKSIVTEFLYKGDI